MKPSDITEFVVKSEGKIDWQNGWPSDKQEYQHMDVEEKLPPHLTLYYETTLDDIKSLNKTRFRLLTLVPAASTLVISLIDKSSQNSTAVAVGILGFIATIALLIYELRNTQIYQQKRYNANQVEGWLLTE